MKQKYKDFFEYNNIQEEGKFRISPSSFGSFYENPNNWYKKQVLKTDRFEGNTSTVIGTILHSRIGAYWSGIEIDTYIETDYLTRFINNAEVNEWEVYDKVTSIWNIVPEYITQIKPISVERETRFNIPNSNYILAGTIDYETEDSLGDIKTTSTTPKQIKVSHKFQLYLYLISDTYSGKELKKYIEVLYIVKTKVPKVVLIKEEVDIEFFNYMKQEVKNMCKRIDMVKSDSELVDILFPNNLNSYLN